MVRNADTLYYPIDAAIRSILPIVDEFVIAVGKSSPGDRTREMITTINDPKIKIIDTIWDLEAYPRGMENAHQTDIAKDACSGDWLIYLQADEVIHEQDFDIIVNACRRYLDDNKVEGMLFNYRHFWGDYNHIQVAHGWYPKEIRIIRNDSDIHSWESAQSFRRIPNFDGKNYRQQNDTYKLRVKQLDAYIYHYGWVRPPRFMQQKRKALDTVHKGDQKVADLYKHQGEFFDYGPMQWAKKFVGSHPKVMEPYMNAFDWGDLLRWTGGPPSNRPLFKHERLKYRMLTWVEQHILGGKSLGGFKNYELLK